MLLAACSPIVSNVALALLLGLDAALSVVIVLAGTALVPLTLPIAAQALVGMSLELPLAAFMGRLALLVGSALPRRGWCGASFRPRRSPRDTSSSTGLR